MTDNHRFTNSNRTQPNRVVITVDPNTGREKYQEKGLFGVIGSLSYNFKF